MKRIVITGISGQDGSYLAEQCLSDGHQVIGILRRTAHQEGKQKLMSLPIIRQFASNLEIEAGDVQDAAFINRVIKTYRPDEFYNLAAMSYVKYSFENPVSTLHINVDSVANIIDALERLSPHTRLYQASSSEMFGGIYIKNGEQQSELTPFTPKSPYGVAKLASHHLMRLARERGLFACCGILFNHESPRRGSEFVTQKICEQVIQLCAGDRNFIDLGNLEARRDWGYAPEYVAGMRKMLDHNKADDYVLATGTSYSIREFLQWALNAVGSGDSPDSVVKVNPENFRPNEVEFLCGDASKAKTVLGWEPKTFAGDLCSKMMREAAIRLYGNNRASSILKAEVYQDVA